MAKYQFLNSFYKYGKDYNDPDLLTIVYRDEATEEKKILNIYEPTMDYFIANEEISHPMKYIDKKLATKHTGKYRYLVDDIARNLGDDYTQFLKDCRSNNQKSKCKTIHQVNEVFGSDKNIEDYWKGKFIDKYKPDKLEITKAFYDIEVDGIDVVGFPDENEAPAPVNANTYIFGKEVHTFLLRYGVRENPLIEKYEKQKKQKEKELAEYFSEMGYKDYKFHLYFFDTELELIEAFFDKVNSDQPDFIGAYNSRFDNKTLYNRIINQGGDPVEIMSHPDFDYRFAEYVDDPRHSVAEERNDYLDVASYTQYVDQYIIYCTLRKGFQKKENYKLGTIARDEIGDEKLNYGDVADIKTLPYNDYDLFVKYNIKDVLLCQGIEEATGDIDFMYFLADLTRTRFRKAMKKSISILNYYSKFCEDDGFIIGNNHNIEYDYDANKEKEEHEKVEGAIVALADLNTPKGIIINGRRSKWVFRCVIDFDLSRMYPSIIEGFNIAPETLIGNVKSEFTEHMKLTSSTNLNDIAGELFEDYNTRDYLFIGYKYANLPNYNEIKTLLDELPNIEEELDEIILEEK